MTTAARPTWDTAKGGTSTRERDLSSMSKQYSSRDLPSHTRLKTRESGQGTADEIRQRDFRRDLEDRERVALRERQKERARKEGKALVRFQLIDCIMLLINIDRTLLLQSRSLRLRLSPWRTSMPMTRLTPAKTRTPTLMMTLQFLWRSSIRSRLRKPKMTRRKR